MSEGKERGVEELICEERLREAAAMCHARGDVVRAVDLLERAAAFEEAARLAVEHGMGAKALRLVAAFGPDELLARASRCMEEPEARALGYELMGRGYGRGAAYAFRAAGLALEEGEAWERAGEFLEAALAYRRGGEDLRAARALGSRLQQKPQDGRALLELGRLLIANGRLEKAAQALQSVPEDAPERGAAKALLARVFERLGLQEARASLGEVEEAPDEEVRGVSRELLYGRYRVEQQVATTAVARVFRCEDRLTGQRVAVKVLRVGAGGLEGRDAVVRFKREALALGLLRHPKILPLLGFFPEGPAVVTPWMEGGSLANVLASTTLSPERAVEIGLAVLDALSEAHRIGILHRDLKPSNVLLDGAGAAYLADFGAAHVGEGATTVTAGLIGSLAYMAPELWAGGKATVASDLYGAGALLYEAITGEQPAPAEDLLVWPSMLYEELSSKHDDALRRLLARSPLDRPATAQEASALLRSLSFRVSKPARRVPRASGRKSETGRRLVPLEGEIAFDTLLKRKVRLVPAEGVTLRLGQAFAQVGREELATIFRWDGQDGVLWVEDLIGLPFAMAQRPLREEEARRLEEALGELHRRGVAHGSVDGEHVRWDDARGVTLSFPRKVMEEATAEGDLAALAALRKAAGGRRDA
ncbi:MAG: tetratricopeptide repeat protein [Myxococcales bacterium]|nr:tetratricopeptide repeat protein [Polyangiaceae bacterium]MDW8248110.1 tetratricopeptide repeat protein [Myxococcales bacterium]